MSRVIYCSVDFGTAGTGCAIGTNAQSIYEHSWANSENRVGSDRSKTRTAVLLNSADLSSVAFGDQAYDLYEEKIRENEEKAKKELLFFDYFKMSLSQDAKSCGNPTAALTRQLMVTATTGEHAPALKVFAASFREIHKSVFGKLHHSSNGRIKSSEIMWIITVPTLWSDAAKQLMREAACEGFPDTSNDQIKLAREPEAAALCCRAQQLDRQLKLSNPLASLSDILKPGSKLIVADLGAGTADFSQLQIGNDGTLAETAAASGGPWGGHLFERRFIEILSIAFGQNNMRKFKSDHPSAFHELERNMRLLKHQMDPLNLKTNRLSLPHAFIEAMQLRANIDKTAGSELAIHRDYHTQIHIPPPAQNESPPTLRGDGKTDEKLEMLDDKVFEQGRAIVYTKAGLFKLSNTFALSLYDSAKAGICSHITNILENNPNASTFFAVGGFSESKVIQHAIEQTLIKFANNKAPPTPAATTATDVKSPAEKTLGPMLVMPLNPGLCVMNGAVHFGINPNLVSTRVAKMGFGVCAASAWDEMVMQGQTKQVRQRGGKLEYYCDQIYSSLSEPGEVLQVECKKKKVFHPSYDNQQSVSFTIYATTKKNVRFLDDPTAELIRIGSVSVDTPFVGNDRDFGVDRDIVVYMSFGCTEITMSAEDLTSGESVECIVDCLDFELDASTAKLSRKT